MAHVCTHGEEDVGLCPLCGHCAHGLVLNGACYYCGEEEVQLDNKSSSVAYPGDFVPFESLRRKS